MKVLVVIVCDCLTSWAFRCMKINWLLLFMASNRLSDLCVLHCHQERVPVDEEKTSPKLATMGGEKRRRMDF